MNPLLKLLPGAAQASLILQALGITPKEEEALGSVIQSAANAPILRQLPKELIPAGPRELITWVTGLKATGVTPSVPPAVLRVLDNPVVRTALANEVERFIMAHPMKEELLAVIGKAVRHVWPETDIASIPTVAKLVDDVVLQQVLASPVSSTVFSCRRCGYTQVVEPTPVLTCRQCNFTQQVK